MSFTDLLQEFCAAVETGDGARFAATFCNDGVYDDVFYGVFEGRENIAGMLENYFWRDGEAFKWDMIDPVDDGKTGYARWFFSYRGRAPHIAGQRIYMQGVGLFQLRDGLIARYEDLAKTAELFQQLNLAPEKQQKITAKMAQAAIADPGFDAHRKL
jgi:hypothetical protein